MVSTSLAHWSRSVHSAPGRLVRCVRANASPNTAIMTSLRSTTSYLVSTKEEKNVGQLLISTPYASTDAQRSVLVLGRSMG